MRSVRGLLDIASSKLKITSETPALDARILLKYILKSDDLYLLTHGEDLVGKKEEELFLVQVEERSHGKPIAYLVGEKEFMGFRFKVTEETLIPRPDTEILVAEAIEQISQHDYKDILDLCSGSGAIGLSIAKILEFTNVTLSDINKGALLVSEENGELLEVSDRLTYIESDLFQEIHGKFDLITCNPPYINLKDYTELSKNVKDFEPEMALYGGVSGLDFYEKISKESKNHLTDEGMIIFEIGYDQSQEVEKMLKNNNFKKIKTLKDLSGRDRVISGILVPET